MSLKINLIPNLEDNYIFFLHDTNAHKTAVVDPGDAKPVLNYMDKNGINKLDEILITHHHWDHINGCPKLIEKFSPKVTGPKKDAHRISFMTDTVTEGDTFTFGNYQAQVFEVPGHTTGHIAYYFENENALFVGDTIFSMGCGRLFEGTPAQMWTSLSKLIALPPETKIYCAHEYTLMNSGFCLELEPNNKALHERIKQVKEISEIGKPTIPTTLEIERETNTLLRADKPEVKENLGMSENSDEEVFAQIRQRRNDY